VIAKILKEKDKCMYKFGFKTGFLPCFSGGFFRIRKRFYGVQNDHEPVVLFDYVNFKAGITVWQ
jgi:hypothetical protein